MNEWKDPIPGAPLASWWAGFRLDMTTPMVKGLWFTPIDLVETFFSRTWTMERLLSCAKDLAGKVENNESAAGELLKQCETLQQQLKAMRQVRIILFLCASLTESSPSPSPRWQISIDV